eukprot:g47095.t1
MTSVQQTLLQSDVNAAKNYNTFDFHPVGVGGSFADSIVYLRKKKLSVWTRLTRSTWGRLSRMSIFLGIIISLAFSCMVVFMIPQSLRQRRGSTRGLKDKDAYAEERSYDIYEDARQGFLSTSASLRPKIQLTLWGVNYNSVKSMYTCKSQEEIDADMAALATITSRVRIYSLEDCGQGRMVLRACQKFGLQLWLGIWVSGWDLDRFFREKDILLQMISEGFLGAGSPVIGIGVGSELLYRFEITIEDIIEKIQMVQSLLRRNNIRIPVGTSDTTDMYIKHQELFDVVDVVCINIFPFWESISVNAAALYLTSRMASVVPFAGNKTVLVTETA